MGAEGIRLRTVDLIAAMPLFAWLGLGIGVSVSQLADASFGTHHFTGILDLAAHIARIAFSGLLVFCLFTRRLPLRRSKHTFRSITAICGLIVPLTIVALPRAEISPQLHQLSLALMLIGTVASLASLWWLGRCFSILPQARGLVTSGPYQLVRHPLYAAELITALGLALQFAQPWALLLFLVAGVIQIVRMGFEEDVLREAFPEYRQYEARTARLVPGIY